MSSKFLKIKNISSIICLLCVLTIVFSCSSPPEKQARISSDFNWNWKFNLGEIENGQDPELDDANWRELRLPHDWSVESPFDSTLEGCTAYLPGGIGWYRKHFSIETDSNKTTYVVFDGVYNNAQIWLNGHLLGEHPFGYSPFYFDLTPHLKTDGSENVLAVRVDRSRYADSRWYTGSGIYRHVELITTDKLHVPVWGTFITTPEISQDFAEVELQIKTKNDYTDSLTFQVKTEIFDPAGKKVLVKIEDHSTPGNQTNENVQNLKVKSPQLWDVDAPNMYLAKTSIILNDKVVDDYETPFGIRSFKFDANEGFSLNGKNMKIKGVCLHHDAGLVGVAVPKGVWKRRLQALKDGGCNAIRTAHNPPSAEFLDLCDEMGFLVQDEFFDEMDNPKDKRRNKNEQSVDYITRGYAEHFQEWAERDLKSTMLRDRNHPSIIQWSIGNEIEWTYPRYEYATGYFDMQWTGNYFWTPPHIDPDEMKKRYDSIKPGQYVLAKTAQKLAAWTKEMDTTRPVTANCILPSASHVTGYTDALDVVGYSYRRVVYDYGHKHYPEKPIMGTENLGQWHEWKAVAERPFVAGLFLWTGIDYMGEANKRWPGKSLSCGLLDLAGFKKPSFHMFKSLWLETPHVAITTQTAEKSIFKIDEKTKAVVEKQPGKWKERVWMWHDVNEHWNYNDEEMIIVEALSNCEEIELFLNDKSLGVKKLADFEDHIVKWAVPFEAGKLVAVGRMNGQAVEAQIITATDPVGVKLTVDKKSLKADGYDVAHVTAQLVDENGNPVKKQERTLEFQMDGDIKLLGVDNGAPDNVQPFQSNKIKTRQGRCLLILQSKRVADDVIIRAEAPGLKSVVATILIR